jgi:hypothetical protein
MDIHIVRNEIDEKTVRSLADMWHGDMVKGVADVERSFLALGGEWHMDANNVLLRDGSQQEDLWGFNIYPNERGGSALEYISLINIRPGQGNREMELNDEGLRDRIKSIVSKLMPFLGL